MDLPEYVNQEDWDGFVAMRKLIKKPLTDRAKTRALKKLETFHKQGENANAVLNQSEDCCWLDLYPVKDRSEPHEDFGDDAL